MKLKNILEASRFREEEEEEDFYPRKDPFGFDDDIYGRPNYPKKDYTDNKFDPEDESTEDEMPDEMDEERENLCYYLRQLFIGQTDFDVDVEMDNLDVVINVQLGHAEKLDDIADIFRIVKKIEEEILVMYDGYFEIWETKRDKATGASNVVLTFEFNYITEDKKPKYNGSLHDDDGFPIF